MRAFIWLDKSNVIFQSCSVVKYCILCQYVSDRRRKGKKKNYKKQMLKWKRKKKKTVLEKRKKTGQPTEFFSLLCFVFFIYKKGKHQKWCLNTEAEIMGGGGRGGLGSDIFLDGRTRLNVCSTHARWSELWPLACPPGSPHSGRRLTILECFIASLYSISWQNVSHLIFPQDSTSSRFT